MSEKQVSFSIEGKPSIVIREMKMKQIVAFGEDVVAVASGNIGLTEISSLMKTLLPQCTDISYDDFMDLAPSEIKGIRAKFEEANNDFLLTLEDFGITQHFKKQLESMKISADLEVNEDPKVMKGNGSEQSLTQSEKLAENTLQNSERNTLSFSNNKKSEIPTMITIPRN